MIVCVFSCVCVCIYIYVACFSVHLVSCPNFVEFVMSGLGVMSSSVQVFVSILHSPILTDMMMHDSSLLFCIHLIRANFTFFTERSPSSGM